MNKIVGFLSPYDYVVRYHEDNKVELIYSEHNTILSQPLVSANKLNILVWNIFKQKRLDCLNVLANYMDKTELILLQEAQTTTSLLNLINQHKKIADHVPAYSINKIHTGVMSIANVIPISSLSFKENEPLIRIPKSALATQYLLPHTQDTLLVANIHAVNFSFGIKIYRQQIRILLNQLKTHQGPVILAGDFNAWSRKRKHLLYSLVRNINLKPVNFTTDIRKKFMGSPLDFIFYRGLKVEQAEIIHTKASDHNPLLVSFILA
ncbi:endonuclease/exonuclease/phosphatase family protein [Orbus sturtevantii]|uniref:endonuclease/exonuclease/phosphatase family protein n=1 Tax=Orbus sturtevantii TaxID=3074109 RepID=UPI00370D1078